MHAFRSHGYYCVVRRHEFISLPFQLISSGTSPEYVLVDQPCFFNLFLQLHPFSSTIRHNSWFFFPLSLFFSLKMWFDVTVCIEEGTIQDGQGLHMAPGATCI
jgi:hypothetical protein